MSGPAGRAASWIPGCAQFAAILLALVVPALRDLGYRLLDVETLVFVPATAGFGALAGLLLQRARRIQGLLFVLFAVCVLDFYFLESWYAVVVAGVVLVALVVSRHQASARNVIALGAAIFVVLDALSPGRELLTPALPGPARAAPATHADRPLLLHFILDEQASPLVALAETREAGLIDRLLEFYVQRGFQSQLSVRAEAGATETSLAGVFGPPEVTAGLSNLLGEEGGFTHRLRENVQLQELVDNQYDVTFIQNSFLKLCVVAAASCHTYTRDNYGHAMRRFGQSLGSRLRLAATLLHVEMLQDDRRGVLLYRPLGAWAIRRGLFLEEPDRNYWTRPAAMLELFDVLDGRAQSMNRGEAWVVHVLLPHFPYMLDRRCALRPYDEWSLPTWVSERIRLPPLMSRLDADYWQQVECVHSRLLSLIDRLDERLGRQNVRVLIHGDHGARLGLKGFRPSPERLQADAPDMSLDALLLVRAPGFTPGMNAERTRLADSVREGYAALLR